MEQAFALGQQLWSTSLANAVWRPREAVKYNIGDPHEMEFFRRYMTCQLALPKRYRPIWNPI